MVQDRQNKHPEEEVGGYGTPTAEQESAGQQFAQPREEEAFDDSGLNESAPSGETYPTGAPDLSHLGTEEKDSAGEPGAGRQGGTEDQMRAEQESDEPGFSTLPSDPGEQPESAHPPVPRDAD